MGDGTRMPANSDRQTMLAVERTRIASERTLMAWVRTAVSLTGFGFAIPEFFASLAHSGHALHPVGMRPIAMGLFLIALGTLGLVAGTVEHSLLLRRIEGGRQWSLATVVAILVCLAGLFAFLAVLGQLPPD